MKFKNWFWGLFFIVAACLVIVNQLGYLTGFNIFTLIASIFLIAIIIQSATHLNFAGILFPFAMILSYTMISLGSSIPPFCKCTWSSSAMIYNLFTFFLFSFSSNISHNYTSLFYI